ncbi:Uncharacterized protein BAE44_0005949, partial [Dichanthelium oligosanthes]
MAVEVAAPVVIGLAAGAGGGGDGDGDGGGAPLEVAGKALRGKYSKAESNVTELKRLGATVLHDVDATKMVFHPDLKNRWFDRIVFNFPHAGFKGKEDDMHMINSHRELVWGFLLNALHLLRPYCEIHISHKTGEAYDQWGLEDLASEASLVLAEKVAFQQEDYPGYNQKRGDSARCDEAFHLGTCFTFKFRIRDLKNWKKLNGDMISSISFLGIMAPATERDPFHLFPPDEAWPRQHLPPPVNAVHMPVTLEPYGVAQRQYPDSPWNFEGTVRDPYFHQQCNTRRMLRTPGPLEDALPNLGGAIPPPMGRIPCPDLLAANEEPWYQHRPTADAPGRDHSCLAWEHQRDVRREYESGDQLAPFCLDGTSAQGAAAKDGCVVWCSEGDAPMAVGVARPELGEPAAEALVGGAGGEAPLVSAGKEEPPAADGVPAIEVEGKGAAALVGGAGGEAAFVDAGKEEPPPVDGGVPAIEVEGKGAAAPLEGAPAVITVEGEDGAHEAEYKEEAEAVAAAAAAAAAAEEDDGQKWLGHYSSGQSTLIIGDGDFSFSLALATAFGSGANLVATSLDTYEALRGMYSKAESNVMELKRLGALVLHGVDAKKMRFHIDLKNHRFDRIVFNFPHAGFKGKEDDMHQINLHKDLLWGFFFNARHLVRRYGEIHVTHKTGLPYDRWDLEHLASGSSLAMVEKAAFRKEDYPGYDQKRGDSARCDEPFDLGACCTFKFQIGDLKKLKKMNGKRAGSIPSLEACRPWQHFPPPPPDNTGGMLMLPPPYIADQRAQPSFPPNSDGMVRAPYFHQQDSFHPMVGMPGPWLDALPPPGGIHQQDSFQPMVGMPGPWLNYLPPPGGIHQQDSFHPMARMPGPWLNAFPPPGGIPPPMGRIPYPDLPGPHEQHWYQQRTVPDQPGGDNYFFSGEYERNLQGEHEMQVMPGATGLNHSAFLEHHHRGGEWLRRMIAHYEALKNKYGRAESNIMHLKRLGATVLHGIDVKTMKFHTDLKNRRFDRIVYNFPHASFKGKEYEVHMINLHKKLVRRYFHNARHLLWPCGEIHVSHKTGESYDKWDLERVAAKFSLILVEKVGFQKAHYPGYNQKKGDGPMCDKPFPLGTCFTFKFKIGDLKKRKKQNRKRAGLVSTIGGSSRPSQPPPTVQALPRLDFPPPANTVLRPLTLLPHVDVQRQ